MDFKDEQNQVDWDKFQDFFSNFNPYKQGSAQKPPLGSEVLITSHEDEHEYIIELHIPRDADIENLKYKMLSLQAFNIVIPKKGYLKSK